MPPDHVINTAPAAQPTAAGDEVTLNVSTGPEQREVPDVASLSYGDAVKKLTAAGQPSSGRPRRNRPQAEGQSAQHGAADYERRRSPTRSPSWSAARPSRTELPDVAGQTVDEATRTSTPSASTILTSPVDSSQPAGEVLGSDPAAGTAATLDSPVTLRVSKGNQFVMPNPGRAVLELMPSQTCGHWAGQGAGEGPDVSAVAHERRGDPKPGGGRRSHLRRVDHPRLRVIAARAERRSRGGRSRRLPAPAGVPGIPRAARRSNRASWPASGAHFGEDGLGVELRRGSATPRAGLP